MSSNEVALILGAALLFWVLASLQSSKRNMMPAILHNAAWIVALLTIGSGLISFNPISTYAWILIGGSIIAFNMGVGVAATSSPLKQQREKNKRPLATRAQYRILMAAFTLGLVIYLATIARLYGIETLLSNPTKIRGDSNTSYLEVFPIYGKILFYLGPLCFVLTLFPEFVAGSQQVTVRIPCALYLAASQLLTLQRTNLFVCLLWVGGLALIRIQFKDLTPGRQNRSRGQLVALIASVVVALVAFQGLALALGKTGNNNAAISSVTGGQLKGSPIASALYYSSSGVAAFSILVESMDPRWPPDHSITPIYGPYNPQTWGKASLSGPLKIVPGIRHWNEISSFVDTPAPTNVFTWLEPWYRDFRAPGVVLGSLTIGLIIGSFARRSGRRPEVTLIAGLLIGLAGLASFANRYMSVMTIVLYLAVWALGRSRERRMLLDCAPNRRRSPSRSHSLRN